ncbi:MAG: hypothetical protein QOJ68_248 [Blastococcus sp.]|nr:hypothetical protein [Blastococcus sp.]
MPRSWTRTALITIAVLVLALSAYRTVSVQLSSSRRTPAEHTQSSAAAPSRPAAGAGLPSGLRVVHAPGTVSDDAHLTPGQCHARTAAGGAPLPDPSCTPGAIDPAVTQSDIADTICRSGYTATVRPPASDTGRWKIRTYVFYGLDTGTRGEYDHLVPLELGGSNATSNLWIEPGSIPNPKDKVENRLRDEVCAGELTLAAAQQAIATDWTTAH